MNENLLKKTEDAINRILKEGIATTNLDHLYKLTKINHMIKEENMYNEYGNYNGRGPGHGSYGNEYGNEYGRRGYDAKYRGHDHLDRMYNEYGRYMDYRGRYGANDQETDKSYHYMLKALEDFIKVLYEEADTPQQKQQLRDTLQRSMM